MVGLAYEEPVSHAGGDVVVIQPSLALLAKDSILFQTCSKFRNISLRDTQSRNRSFGVPFHSLVSTDKPQLPPFHGSAMDA